MQNDFKQNEAVIKQAYQAFGSGNVQGITDLCTEDVVFNSYDQPAVSFTGIHKGHKGVADYFSELAADIEYKNFEPREFFGDENNVLVRGFHEGVIKPTSRSFAHDFVMHFRMRDGKISEAFVFTNI